MKHTANIGPTEKWVRIGLGTLAGVAAWQLAKKNRWASGLLALTGISGLQSGITNYCAVKNLLGFKSVGSDWEAGEPSSKGVEKIPVTGKSQNPVEMRETLAI